MNPPQPPVDQSFVRTRIRHWSLVSVVILTATTMTAGCGGAGQDAGSAASPVALSAPPPAGAPEAPGALEPDLADRGLLPRDQPMSAAPTEDLASAAIPLASVALPDPEIAAASASAIDAGPIKPQAKSAISGTLVDLRSTAADPAAAGAIGNFFIRHTFPGIETANTPISLAYLNATPAGANGPITVSGGHLALAGRRIRLYGINMPIGAFLPSREQAPVLATRLAKEGFNAVRIFGFDALLVVPNAFSVTYKPQGILNNDQSFNAEALDRLDFFIYRLQLAGIYVAFPLHAARVYPQSPDCIQACEGLDNYLPSLIQSQKDFAAAFLNHINPYSGKAYKADAGVFALEINNENSLTHRWANGTVDRYLTERAFASKYGQPLEALWQVWAQRKYGTTAAAGKAWLQTIGAWADVHAPLHADVTKIQPQLFRDWADFMADTESAYKQDMSAFLKHTLGATALVYDTQNNYNQPFSRDGMDMVDVHSYFGDLGTNTGLTNRPGNGRPVFDVQNRSALHYADLKDGGMYAMFVGKDLNKPNIITEYTYRDGNQYAAEAEPLMAAYAGFQDLDAIFLFNYHGMNLYTNPQTYPGWYNMTINGLTRVAAALAFRRGDMTPGAPQVLKKTRQSWLNTMAAANSLNLTNYSYGGNVRAPYTRNMYVQMVNSVAQEQIVSGGAAAADGVYTSTSGEIRWKPLDRITVDSARSKTAIGFFRNVTVPLGSGIEVAVGNTINNYAVLSLISLNDRENLPASRMLFSIAGHFTVPGEYPRTPGSNRYSWGDDAPRIEAVPATVRITTSANLVVTALDATGARKANVPVVRKGGRIEFVTGPAYDTGWYLIDAARQAN